MKICKVTSFPACIRWPISRIKPPDMTLFSPVSHAGNPSIYHQRSLKLLIAIIHLLDNEMLIYLNSEEGTSFQVSYLCIHFF